MTRKYLAAMLVFTCLIIITSGCVKKTITDERITERVQEFIDTPYDPNDKHSLKPEEAAAIESFEIYNSKIKITMVPDTPQELWDPIARKVIRAFGFACREYEVLDHYYYADLYVNWEVEDERETFLVGEIRMQNSTDRVTVELLNPSRARRK